MLYTAYGESLTQSLSETLSPDFWQAHGVLFNPASIPPDGPDAYMVLSGLSPVEQDVNKEVTYFGNVTARISGGIAHIMDSCGEVNAVGQAKVYAYGQSQVNARNESEVFYMDCSRGMAHDSAVAHACDRSYVSVGEGNVTLHAHDMAQFAVFQGGATVFVDGSARGIVAPVHENHERIQVHMTDQGLLVTKEDGNRCVLIESEKFSGTVIRVREPYIDASLLRNMITPRYEAASSIESRLEKPLKCDQLKNDLNAFIDSSMPPFELSFLSKATDERSVCFRMVPLLRQLMANGLTGDFLRTHFTEQTLEENLIHAFSRPETSRDNHHEEGTHYFFGDQLVHAKRYGGKVVCHEKALLIVDECGRDCRVDGQAHGISMGTGNLDVQGAGRVIGLDHSHITAGEQSRVHAYGHSFVEANGHAWLDAHQGCSIEGIDHCRVFLDGDCIARLGGYAVAQVEDSNYVVAEDHAIVGYREIHKDGRQVVKALSPTVQVHKLNTEKEREAFRSLILEERKVSSLMKR